MPGHSDFKQGDGLVHLSTSAQVILATRRILHSSVVYKGIGLMIDCCFHEKNITWKTTLYPDQQT